jgi:hypothetical protein
MANLIADGRGNPTPVTKYVASAIVGIGAAAVAGAVFKKSAPALVVLLVVFLAHQKFDAPAAKAIVSGARDVGLA